MRHHKFNEVKILVENGINVLLTGEKGSGKTTLAMQVAEDIGVEFFNMSMTRQTTLSHLFGFMSVNGTYVGTHLRKAAEFGGMMNLDEIDAADANVLLSLNTIENGFLVFPDAIVDLHKDFHLVATSNPQDQHASYVGRNKLDAATLDRFDIIDIDRDENLEMSMVDLDVYQHISALREVLGGMNSSKVVSMRDTLRYQKRKDLSLLEGFVYRLTGKNDLAMERYDAAVASIPKYSDQSECKTIDELITLMELEKENGPVAPKAKPDGKPENEPATDFPEDDDIPF